MKNQSQRKEPVNYEANEQKTFTHVDTISYNCVIIGLIIVVMLVVFQNLAGLDSVQDSAFSGLHNVNKRLALFYGIYH
jgi:hypothetical protein